MMIIMNGGNERTASSIGVDWHASGLIVHGAARSSDAPESDGCPGTDAPDARERTGPDNGGDFVLGTREPPARGARLDFLIAIRRAAE